MTKRAVLWIRTQPHYRRGAFASGLEALGFKIMDRVNDPRPGDVLVSWNMYPSNEPVANAWRKAGAKVLIVENGFVGKDAQSNQLYAIARDAHNGAGEWYIGLEDRWAALGLEVKPFHPNDRGSIIVRAQRGIGTKLMASPPRWARETVAALQKVSGRPVELRLHPGTDVKQERDDPDEKAIARAYAVVVWASSFGVKAIISGVPTYFCAPFWICSGAAARILWPYQPDGLKLPALQLDENARKQTLHKLAWAQWRLEEISAGTPFELLLKDA